MEKVEGGIRLHPRAKSLYSISNTVFPSIPASSITGNINSMMSPTKLIPIASQEQIEDIYEGLVEVIRDEVLGKHKWDELFHYE